MKQIEKHPAPEKLLQQITEAAINALALGGPDKIGDEAPMEAGVKLIAKAWEVPRESLQASLCPAPGEYRDFEVFHGYVEQYAWRTDPKIYTMNCPECGTALIPDDVWLKKGSNSWYTLSQCPHCAGSGNAVSGGVFQRYKLARRDGLHWSFARCLQLPDEALLARWNKQRAAQLERLKNRAEKSAEN